MKMIVRVFLLLSLVSIFETANSSKMTPLESLKRHLDEHIIPEIFEPKNTNLKDYVPKVTVPDFGTARGKVLNSGRTDFYAFMGIPYAKPPTGTRRFKATVPWSGKWNSNGDYDATWIRPKCPQGSFLSTESASGDEDCLTLNIYIPSNINLTDTFRIPVMMFIHGGTYTSGEASLYIPTKLMDTQDVVVVVIQYRLSTLGFLYSGTDSAPGNMGLLDQVTALKWVHEYIGHFCGNRDMVTVFGQSAGGASTSLLHLSPLINADDTLLMHRLIAMSGSAFEYWTIDTDPDDSLRVHALAFDPPCYEEGWSNNRIMICINLRDTNEVIAAANKVYKADRKAGLLGFRGMCPVVQSSPNITSDKVLPYHPIELVEMNQFPKIPMMQGSVRDEGSMVAALVYDGFIQPNKYENDTEFIKFDMIPKLMDAFGVPDTTNAMTNVMNVAFLGNSEMGDLNSMMPGMVDMLGMLFLKSGSWTLAQKMIRTNPDIKLFFYSFEFESDDSLFNWMFISEPDIPVEHGVAHADDLLYLFGMPALQDERELAMVYKLTTMYSRFAVYGDPTPYETVPAIEGVPRWIPFNLEDLNFMLIEDTCSMQSDFKTRWFYNSNQQGKDKKTHEDIKDENPSHDFSKGEDHHHDHNGEEDRNPYKISTAILASVLGCVIIGFVVFIIVKNKTKLPNVEFGTMMHSKNKAVTVVSGVLPSKE